MYPTSVLSNIQFNAFSFYFLDEWSKRKKMVTFSVDMAKDKRALNILPRYFEVIDSLEKEFSFCRNVPTAACKVILLSSLSF